MFPWCSQIASSWHSRLATAGGLVIMIEMLPDPRTREQLGLRQELGNVSASLCFCLCICFFSGRYRQTRLLCPTVCYRATTRHYLGSPWIHSLGRCHSFNSRLLAEARRWVWLSRCAHWAYGKHKATQKVLCASGENEMWCGGELLRRTLVRRSLTPKMWRL